MSNIISDDEFMKEILGNSSAKQDQTSQSSESDDLIKTILDSVEEECEDCDKDSSEGSDKENDPKDSESEEGLDSVQISENASLKRFGLKDTISTLLESDTWIDSPIMYGDKEYESISDLIEKEKPTKEMFRMLSEAQKEYRDQELQKSYIKIDDYDSSRVKLASAILNGVPVDDMLDDYDSINELISIDFTQLPEEEAAEFVRQCLIDIDGYHPASVDLAVQGMAQNFELIPMAQKYQSMLQQQVEEELYAREQEYQQMVQEEAEVIKQDMIAFKNTVGDMKISPEYSNLMFNLRYNIDPDTGRYHFEELLAEKMQDKGFEARLMHFLLNEEDFINRAKSTVKADTQKNIMQLMKISNNGKGSKASKPSSANKSGNLATKDEDFLRDIGLLD